MRMKIVVCIIATITVSSVCVSTYEEFMFAQFSPSEKSSWIIQKAIQKTNKNIQEHSKKRKQVQQMDTIRILVKNGTEATMMKKKSNRAKWSQAKLKIRENTDAKMIQ